MNLSRFLQTKRLFLMPHASYTGSTSLFKRPGQPGAGLPARTDFYALRTEIRAKRGAADFRSDGGFLFIFKVLVGLFDTWHADCNV
jgi:hypothetical protein